MQDWPAERDRPAAGCDGRGWGFLVQRAGGGMRLRSSLHSFELSTRDSGLMHPYAEVRPPVFSL